MKYIVTLGILVVFGNAAATKNYYTLKIIRKNAPSTYSQVFLSKSDCEAHRQILLKQNSGSGYGYKCVIKSKIRTKVDGISLMR